MKYRIETSQDELIIRIDCKELDLPALRKRAHDLKGATRTISFCVDNLKEGYRFDDDVAEAKIKALSKAADTIQAESLILDDIYRELLETHTPSQP